MSQTAIVEYIWVDGCKPTKALRSKARVVQVGDAPSSKDFPNWSFDGSSTNQATGDDSDCILRPVHVVRDPVRGGNSYLVLCEVLNADGSAHASNSRAALRAALAAGGDRIDPWIGFEQEYTLFKDGRPLGWPESGYPGAQGPYYCGVGAGRVFGRELVEAHAAKCLEAGVMLYGINAEVMPGQWEFQIGYRGFDDESGDVLRVCDDLLVARWMLQRLGEERGIEISFANKPIEGDWNGAGMHTNFSTAGTRDAQNGMAAIRAAVDALSHQHDSHIHHYGDGLERRLTGQHETCSINTFRSGVADRGASIRIPQSVSLAGYGYLEDRRPGANADPYVVATCIVTASAGVCSGPIGALRQSRRAAA
jgi:glutamine synthetase